MLLYVAAGGAVGALARYGLSGWVHRYAGAGFPWGTLAVNLIGCFLIGLSMRWLEATSASAELRTLVTIGLLGAFVHGPHKGESLYEALLELLRRRGCAGATVLRGIAGFGASARLHTERILRLSVDLPIVVEVVETEERIQELLPELERMIGGGLITLERARVILYRPSDTAQDERQRHRVEGLEADGE